MFGHRHQIGAPRGQRGLHGVGQGAAVNTREKHAGDLIGEQEGGALAGLVPVSGSGASVRVTVSPWAPVKRK